MRGISARQLARIAGIAILVVLFTGMIAYSARLVRYPLDGVPTSELTITNLSLTHEVERTADGKFTNPYAESAVPVESTPKVAIATDAKPIVVAAAPGFTLCDMTAKSTKAKPAPKKPSPKKPAPKKPAPKKSGKSKACPT